MGLTLVTPAATFPVTLTEAKAQCRVLHASEDVYIGLLIEAAAAHIQEYTGRSVGAQTWKLTLDKFFDEILLPRGPVQSVESVEYFDADGQEQTLVSGWALDASTDPARILRDADASWPSTAERFDAVAITYDAGGTSPADVKHAALLLVAHWYHNREAVGTPLAPVPMAVEALLTNHRSYGFGQ